MMDGWMGVIKGLTDKCRIMADNMDRIVADVKHDDDTSEAARQSGTPSLGLDLA
jgi:hypothetical protein